VTAQLENDVPPPTITPVLVAELLVEGERMPVYVHVIDHPDARVLVDTGLTQLHPAVADMDPRLIPLSEQTDVDLAGIDIVINTHLHFDHCGGNHLFAGKPTYVQRRELDDARTQDDYTIREWVQAPGVQYVPVDGELELLPGLRLVPTPGHTPGSQVVVVETGGPPVVIGGDTAVFYGELDEPRTEGHLPYAIGDSRFLDGGFRRSSENADLATGYGRVLVLSPFRGRSLAPPQWGLQLAAQVDELRAGGSRVETIFPDSESEHLFGANAMDPSLRAPAARTGHEQGRALAEHLTDFWR
jgi:N-acyl homoserine lactone hydrolase